MMSHWSIKGIAAHADYFQQAKTVAKMDTKTNYFCWVGINTVEIK